jgi:hypothetical protein
MKWNDIGMIWDNGLYIGLQTDKYKIYIYTNTMTK